MRMSDLTTIPLTKETRDMLKRIGRKGETYDELIRRLITIVEKAEFIQRQHRILKSEEFVPLDDL